MEKYLSELNQAQLAPVLQKEGAMMVIAGAGSGKTRVLTYRIAHLMQQGVLPYNILALTFTNKSAREMKERIGKIVGQVNARDLWMGTFHSVFAKILRFESEKLGYPKDFTIYDQQDSQRLINSIIKEMGLDKNTYKYREIASRISSMKNKLILANDYRQNKELLEKDAMAKRPRFVEIYDNYLNRCFKSGVMDFDDLLLQTYHLLQKNQQVREKYQKLFQYILVDEYQDTNRLQYLIVRTLSQKYKNVCIVGDDAQSIYAFRGADIHNIFNFEKDYENVSTYRLEQNYRSTKHIVLAANSVIKNNVNRLEKVVWTDNQWGDPIKVHRSMNDTEEAIFVANTIIDYKIHKHIPNGNFAILYRTNAQSRVLEDALRKKDIPYRIYGGLSFYQRKEVKDVLSYFRLIVNPNDEEALKRIINFPARGIGDTTLEKLSIIANQYQKTIFEVMFNINIIDDFLKIGSSTKSRITEFTSMILDFQSKLSSFNAFDLAELIIKKTGLLLEFKKDETSEGIERLQNIEELLNGIKDFVNGQDTDFVSLNSYLEDIALATDQDKNIEDQDRVSLMTIHLSKGLEFPYVFIVGLEENLFPSALSNKTPSELEEERRLFYVALTRAEKQAYLTYCENRFQWGKYSDGNEPSRFLFEIDSQHLQYLTPEPNSRFKRNNSSFQKESPLKSNYSKLLFEVPKSSPPPSANRPNAEQMRKLRLIKPEILPSVKTQKIINLTVGDWVTHERFGKGRVIRLEGSANDTKADIDFEQEGLKKILLKFSKLSKI